MLEAEILGHPPLVLSQQEREAYFTNGFVVVEDYVPMDWIERLRKAADRLTESARSLTEDTQDFRLAHGHSKDSPRLERIERPQDYEPEIWEFLSTALIVDLVADLVGPNVRFNHCGMNMKPGGKQSQPFFWHQDILAWPHTDFSPLTLGIYLDDVTPAQGPLGFLPGSHKSTLYPTFAKDMTLLGAPREVIEEKADEIVFATGGAGTVVAINCCVLHGSNANLSDQPRRTILGVYSSADSLPYTRREGTGNFHGTIVRGEWPEYASFDLSKRIPLPPQRSHSRGLSPWKGDGESLDVRK